MTFKENISLKELNVLYIISLLALVQLFVALFSNGFALSFDEAMWHYIGRNWFRNGLAPYSGGVDNKSPLIFAVFGLSDSLFGVNYWFPRVLGTLCQSIGIYYVYKIAKHKANQQTGVLACMLYGLSLLWHDTGGKYVSFTETFEVMFLIIAFYRNITGQTNKDFFVSGIMAGIGFGFRLSAFLGIIALFVVSFRKSGKDTLLFCAGVLSAISFLLVVGALAGIDVRSIFTYTLTDNFGPGSATYHTLTWKMQNFSEKFFYSGMVLFYPLVLVYLFINRKIDLFVLWLILAFIGINIIGIYDRVHLRELLPVLSLISAFSINHLINVFKFPPKLAVPIILIIFFPNLSEACSNLKKTLRGLPDSKINYCQAPFIKPDEEDCKKLGWWIKSNTPEQEKVLVAGFGAQVQVYSERVSPSVYFNVTQTPIAKARFFSDLRINEPGMILIPLFSEYTRFVDQDMRLFIDKLIQKEYHLDECMYGYNVYKINK